MRETTPDLYVAAALTLVSALGLPILLFRWKKRTRDILQTVLEKSVPVAAAEELAFEGAATCERKLNGKQLVITADPQLADYIFNGPKKNNYIRRPADDAGLRTLGMFGRGLIWNNDLAVWHKIRDCFQKALGEKTLGRAVTVAKHECRELLNNAVGECSFAKPINLLDISRRVTFRVTLNVFFGLPSSVFSAVGIEEEKFIKAIVAYFKAWEFFLLRPDPKHDLRLHEVHVDAIHTLRTHVKQLLKATDNDNIRNYPNEFLFIDHLRLICQEGDTAGVLLLEQSVLEMLLAGTDTSSVTAYYALLGLAGDSGMQRAIRDEILSFPGKKKRPLLDSVINETLRFKPVGPVVLRQAVEADPNFPGTTYSIQKGAAILVHLAEMNLREEYWENPRTFQPRRFLEELSSSDKKIFFPFGEGPKGCIGMHLGRREVNAIVETVVLNYDMTSIEGMETLDSLQTHWDIANQPDKPAKIFLRPLPAK